MSQEQSRQQGELTIIVEGTPHQWSEPLIRYAQVVTFFDTSFPQHPEVTYTVTYEHGPHQNVEGTMPPGSGVYVKNRMVFHVSPTGQS